MKAYLKSLASEAAQPVEDMLGRLVMSFAFVAMAVGCVIAALAFLTADLFLYLESVSSTIVAAGAVAAIYLVLALIFFIVAFRKPAKRHDPVDAPPAVAAPTVAAFAKPAAAAQSGEAPRLFDVRSSSARPSRAQFAANIDAAVAPVVSAMREAGMQKEAQAVEAGGEVAKNLPPYALILAAVGAGVFLGRTMTTKRKLF